MYGILNTLDEADEIRHTKRAMQHASVSPALDQHDFTSLHQFSTTDCTLNLESRLKELFTFKKTFAGKFTHPHVIQDIHVFLSSAEKKLRFLMKTFQDFSPYNAL